jgi:hypothetical protein
MLLYTCPLHLKTAYLEERPGKLKNEQLIMWAQEICNGMSYLEKKK